MEKFSYFDYCAIVIILILIVSTMYRGMTKSRIHRMYLTLLGVAFFATLMDICAVWIDRIGPGHVYGKYVFHTAYLWLHNLSTPMYVLFLLMMAGVDYKLQLSHKVCFSLPFGLMFISLFLNNFNHKIFYLDGADAYTRGPWFFILYVTTAFYIVTGFYVLIRFRKRVNRDQFFCLFAMFPILVSAMLIQLVMPRFLFEMLASALVMLLFSTMVIRPEDFIDTDTGMGKKSAYVTDMKRALTSGNIMRIIMINITNYNAIHRMLGYITMQDFVRQLAQKLDAFNEEQKLGSEVYYLGNGRFRFVFDKRRSNLAEEAAKKLNELLQQDIEFNGMGISLLGVVCLGDCPEVISDVPALMAFGEELTEKYYNGQVLYSKDIYNKERYEILNDMDSIIEDAIANRKFQVYYQPIYSLKEKRFNSAEALLRLIDEKYGFISPELFIPEAERSGAIHRIGTYVTEEVCKFIASDEYKKLGLDYIEINLSVVQCMRGDLAEEIISILDKYKVEPNQVNLEITETAASYSQNTMMDNIEKLTQYGIPFSLDDYGIGYSNVKRIATMPLDIVKLDKSFINVGNNERLRIVLENTIRMIKAMKLKIVVEGVETKELVEMFDEFECEYIQGYYFSKPLPKKDFISFVESKLGNTNTL